MNKKLITMDYEEYEDLLNQLEVLKGFMKDYYNLVNDRSLKQEIHKFMQSYGNWC